MIYSWKLGLHTRAGLRTVRRRVGVGYPFNIAIVRHGGHSNIM
jgi:hypothetical protein